MRDASLDIRADDVELQDLLQDSKRESSSFLPMTPLADDFGDDTAAEDDELLLKKRSSSDDTPPKLPWLQLLFYLVMRASS